MELRCIRLGLKMIFGLIPLLSGVALATQPAPSIHSPLWPENPPAFAPDGALETRISKLLAQMTLEQKVGQLIQADIGSITPDDLRHYPLGSILNGGSSSPGNNEFSPPSEWLTLADRFYEASTDPSYGPHPIPTMWGTDAVHGHNNVVGATIFPHNIALEAAHNPELVRQIGEITAREVRAAGIEWIFGPTLAVVRDDRWGRTLARRENAWQWRIAHRRIEAPIAFRRPRGKRLEWSRPGSRLYECQLRRRDQCGIGRDQGS